MKSTFFAITLFLLTACSISNVHEAQEFNFEILPIKQLYEASNQIQLIEKSSISSIPEENLKIILEPFVQNGKEIYDSIKQSDEVIEFISSGEFDSSKLDDSFYAQLSIIYTILAHQPDNANSSQSYKNSVSYDTASAYSCLSVALGIETVKNLGISGLMTAKGAIQILKVFAKRYFLGYVGTAVMIYEFGKCMNVLKRSF